jgi:putative SOS response-associated peptidase YedK
MCGRFTNRLTWREIVSLYRLSVPAQPERNLPGGYNICPTDTIDAVARLGLSLACDYGSDKGTNNAVQNPRHS